MIKIIVDASVTLHAVTVDRDTNYNQRVHCYIHPTLLSPRHAPNLVYIPMAQHYMCAGLRGICKVVLDQIRYTACGNSGIRGGMASSGICSVLAYFL